MSDNPNLPISTTEETVDQKAALDAMIPGIRVRLDTKRKLQEKYDAAKAAFEAEHADLVAELDTAKAACQEDEDQFRAQALRVFEETGEKKYYAGKLTIQERKEVAEYDKVAVEAWIRTFHPGWLKPDFKAVEAIALDGYSPTTGKTKAGFETPLTVQLVPKVAVSMDKLGA